MMVPYRALMKIYYLHIINTNIGVYCVKEQ
jgi:hypothetical protein